MIEGAWKQPPLGGCVLKPVTFNSFNHFQTQPPLGGCVLKHREFEGYAYFTPAAFRRLCVETFHYHQNHPSLNQPPLGGCVLKHSHTLKLLLQYYQPPLGGCVLKHHYIDGQQSHADQPPLGGCVLKHAVGSTRAISFTSRL